MRHSARIMMVLSSAGCAALPPVVARLPEVTVHAADPEVGARGVRAWKACSDHVPEILGIDSRWHGRIVFLSEEVWGPSCAFFDPGGTIYVGSELQETEAELTFVLAHELTHALAKDEWVELLPSALQEGIATWVGSRVTNRPAAPADWYPPMQDVRRMLTLSPEDFAKVDQGYLECVAAWYVQHLGLDYIRERAQAGGVFEVLSARHRLTHYGADGSILAEDYAAGLPFGGSTPEGTVRTEVDLVFVPGEPVVPGRPSIPASGVLDDELLDH